MARGADQRPGQGHKGRRPAHIVAGGGIGPDGPRVHDPLIVPGRQRLPGDRRALQGRAIEPPFQVGRQIGYRQIITADFGIDRCQQVSRARIGRRVDPAADDPHRHVDDLPVGQGQFLLQDLQAHRGAQVDRPDAEVAAGQALVDRLLQALVQRGKDPQRRNVVLQPAEVLVVNNQRNHHRETLVVHARKRGPVMSLRRGEDQRAQPFQTPGQIGAHEGLDGRSWPHEGVRLRAEACQVGRGGGQLRRSRRRSWREGRMRWDEEQAQEQANTAQGLPDHASSWNGAPEEPAPHRAELA